MGNILLEFNCLCWSDLISSNLIYCYRELFKRFIFVLWFNSEFYEDKRLITLIKILLEFFESYRYIQYPKLYSLNIQNIHEILYYIISNEQDKLCISSFHFFINFHEDANFHKGIRSPIIPIKDPPIWLTGNFTTKLITPWYNCSIQRDSTRGAQRLIFRVRLLHYYRWRHLHVAHASRRKILPLSLYIIRLLC